MRGRRPMRLWAAARHANLLAGKLVGYCSLNLLQLITECGII
jgi:hypothetical protein